MLWDKSMSPHTQIVMPATIYCSNSHCDRKLTLTLTDCRYGKFVKKVISRGWANVFIGKQQDISSGKLIFGECPYHNYEDGKK